jgi:hypothetical protein
VEYVNFRIELTGLQGDGTFKARVLGQTPGGEMSEADAERPTFHRDETQSLIARLERRRATVEEFYQLGECLATLILPGRVRQLLDATLQRLDQDHGVRLQLDIQDLELAALPWEYTFVQRTGGEKVPSDFLALQRGVSITRYEMLGVPLAARPTRDHLRIVVALAAPTDQAELDLEADERAIMAAVNVLKAEAPGVESVVVENATRESLLAALAGADIFHFAGHGVFEGTELAQDGSSRSIGKILLEDQHEKSDRYPSDQLAVNLGNAGVRLVVLGACNSASRDAGGAWTGVAPALVRENIPAVVAMQLKVRDQHAGPFMAYLYSRVLGGGTIDEAVFEGRQAIFAQSGLLGRDWGVPVLHMRDADGVLFPLPGPSTAGATSPAVNIQRKLREVSGTSIGVRIADTLGIASVNVVEDIGVVKKGAVSIGAEIGQHGH